MDIVVEEYFICGSDADLHSSCGVNLSWVESDRASCKIGSSECHRGAARALRDIISNSNEEGTCCNCWIGVENIVHCDSYVSNCSISRN